MLRELAISCYLFCFQLVFKFFNRHSTQNKTTFVASFGSNIQEIIKELEQQLPTHEIVVLKANNCRVNFHKNDREVFYFESKNIVQWIKSIYHLATSSHIIVDNYYGFLAVTNFKENVTCVQVWHAAGAIKQFGLEDLTNHDRSPRALERFRKVYDRFDHVIVGSDEMVNIYKKSFGLKEDRFVKTGIPRTDYFFNDILKQQALNELEIDFPIIKDKKVLFYAPTYRDNDLHGSNLELDISRMYDAFKYEYVLFLRLHPAVSGEFENKYPGFVYNVSNHPSINKLLTIADILITDYSSIPFEFALLNRPMIFFAYDLEDYAVKRGVWPDYIAQVPGPVVETTSELIEVITLEDFQQEKVAPFAQKWNQYSHGDATLQFLQHFYETAPLREKEMVSF